MCDKCDPTVSHEIPEDMKDTIKNKPYLYIMQPNILHMSIPRQMNDPRRIAASISINYCPWCGRDLNAY